MDGFSHGPAGLLVCHCLLVETNEGLALIDTGFGMRDMERPSCYHAGGLEDFLRPPCM